MKRYRTIVADPPWDHSDGTGIDISSGRVTSVPYATMSLEDIRALPVKALSDNVDGDGHLYLWTTSRYLPHAFAVARAWGFRYTATLVWCKQPRGFAPGGTFQNNVEFVLYGRRPSVTRRPDVLVLTSALADAAEQAGVTRADIDRHMGTSDMGGWWLSRIEHRCACPTVEQWPRLKALLGIGDDLDPVVSELNERKGQDRQVSPQGSVSRWFQWPRGEHSAKPDAFLDLVEQVSPGPYLELFARRARFGWDYWGDESLGTAEMPQREAAA